MTHEEILAEIVELAEEYANMLPGSARVLAGQHLNTAGRELAQRIGAEVRRLYGIGRALKAATRLSEKHARYRTVETPSPASPTVPQPSPGTATDRPNVYRPPSPAPEGDGKRGTVRWHPATIKK